MFELEPERYELSAPLACDFELSRRELWKTLGGGILLLFTASSTVPGSGGRELLSARLHIGENGAVTLLTGKVEIGQGARTLLTQVVAEELRMPMSKVRVVMADTALVPDDGGTWASLTTPLTVPVVRRAAATARQMLPKLAPGQQLVGEVRLYAPVTDPNDWKVCGTPAPPVNGRSIVTGAHRYASDLRVPGMLHGKIVRPPGHRSTLLSFDAKAAERMPGVQVVRDGNLLGVVAPEEQTAARAAAQIRAQWKTEPLGQPAELVALFKKTAREPVYRKGARYPALLQRGSLASALASAEHRHESSYSLHSIAHVPLEPRAAIAEWDGDKLTVRCGTQVPFGVRTELAAAFHVPEENVRVIVPDTGAGFGSKHRGECELETARLAKSAGRPVRLAWTREEEFTCAYSRPAGLVEVRSGFAADGKVQAWDFHNYNSGAAGLAPPYAIPNYYCGFHPAEAPLRQGSYRSLAAVANTFARETHMEEIAERLNMDPLELRLRNLENTRLREVLERAAEKFGWGGRKGGRGTGFGLACNVEKGGHLALFVELETNGNSVRLHRIVSAFDCGAILNPDNLHNQAVGAMIQGVGGALFEQLIYDREQIRNPRLSAYRVPRFSDVPSVELILIDRRDVVSAGAGESPITVVAPAIGAALRQATGRRFRSLPMLAS